MNLLKLWKNQVDIYLFIAIIALSIFGLLNLAGIFGVSHFFFKKQLIFVLVGIGVLFFSSFIDYRIFKSHSLPATIFLVAVIILLFATLGSEPIRGVSSWLHLPFGLSFESSEVAKLALILFLSRYFSIRATNPNLSSVLISAVYVFALIFLVFSQPDFGSAFILFLIWLGGLILLGLKKEYWLSFIVILVIIFSITVIFILEPYQKLRFVNFLNRGFDPLGTGYNSLQAKIAIGSGGLTGLGFGKGFQGKYGLLPEVHSDFAFAAFAEQFGLLGIVGILFFFSVILNRLFRILLNAKDNFSRFFIFMFTVYFFSHVIINIGMNLGLLPITGLPLPFISYGGSYFISLMVGFGIVNNVNRR